MQSIKDQSFFREGRKDLLFSTPDNPYESIYIYAEIKRGCLVITDSECDHAPDGGWSHQVITFDAGNTEKPSLYCVNGTRIRFRRLPTPSAMKSGHVRFWQTAVSAASNIPCSCLSDNIKCTGQVICLTGASFL